ncbi:MAG: hypothetical protein GXO82_10985 [Chlorobi bacterium]|nr:hypothetical protein [Chlorobiota bacterium]
MPALEVKVEKATPDGLVEGKVTHKTTGEYANTLTYQGEVTVFVNGKIVQKVQVDPSGAFTVENLTLSENDKVRAEIGFGGIYVKSDEVTVSSLDVLAILHECNEVYLSLYAEHIFNDGTYALPISVPGASDSMLSTEHVSWNGQSFSQTIERRWKDGWNNIHVERNVKSGSVSSDGKWLNSISGEYYYELSYDGPSETVEKWSTKIELRNIPLFIATPRRDNELPVVYYKVKGPGVSAYVIKVVDKSWTEDKNGTRAFREYISTNWNSSKTSPKLEVGFDYR